MDSRSQRDEAENEFVLQAYKLEHAVNDLWHVFVAGQQVDLHEHCLVEDGFEDQDFSQHGEIFAGDGVLYCDVHVEQDEVVSLDGVVALQAQEFFQCFGNAPVLTRDAEIEVRDLDFSARVDELTSNSFKEAGFLDDLIKQITFTGLWRRVVEDQMKEGPEEVSA